MCTFNTVDNWGEVDTLVTISDTSGANTSSFYLVIVADSNYRNTFLSLYLNKLEQIFIKAISLSLRKCFNGGIWKSKATLVSYHNSFWILKWEKENMIKICATFLWVILFSACVTISIHSAY